MAKRDRAEIAGGRVRAQPADRLLSADRRAFERLLWSFVSKLQELQRQGHWSFAQLHSRVTGPEAARGPGTPFQSDPTGERVAGNQRAFESHRRALRLLGQSLELLEAASDSFDAVVEALDAREDWRDPTGEYGRKLVPALISKGEYKRLRRKQTQRRRDGYGWGES